MNIEQRRFLLTGRLCPRPPGELQSARYLAETLAASCQEDASQFLQDAAERAQSRYQHVMLRHQEQDQVRAQLAELT